MQSLSCAILQVMGYWGDGAQRTYHHTAPVNTLYGLHESLVMMLEEAHQSPIRQHAIHSHLMKLRHQQ
jgi:alanine-glyoxylate transaminase/serine-glyoxylate transaminase/serine-pyruvate transaminase